jgi:hypothetical protein
MPGWGELLKELTAELAGLPPDQAGQLSTPSASAT